MQLDSTDQKLLNRLQDRFPLVSQPYAEVGRNLDISENEVIRRIGRLRAEGIIRQIGPLLDTRKLNYKTTLVAMRVIGTELDRAAQVLAEHPVSHAYERDHYFNLWFTLAFPATVYLDTRLREIVSPIRAEAVFSLPALRLFKLRVYFDVGGEGQSEMSDAPSSEDVPQPVQLSDEERGVINEIQQDLPMITRPFTEMAIKVGMRQDRFLEQCRYLLARGIIRRFSASVNHREVGFAANGMVCWAAPPEKVEMAGQRLASLREVSHCYERKTNPLWRYNLFAMVHGQTREDCQSIAARVSAETGLGDYVVLFSTREFRKTRLRYPV